MSKLLLLKLLSLSFSRALISFLTKRGNFDVKRVWDRKRCVRERMKRHPPPIKDSWQLQDSFSIIHFIMQGHLFSFEVSSTQMITCFSRAEHHLFFLLNFFLDSLPLLFSLPSFQSMNNISYTKERTLRVSTKSVRQHKIPMKDQPTIALLYKFFIALKDIVVSSTGIELMINSFVPRI